MIQNKVFLDSLRERGVELFTGVPDSLLKDFCAFIDDYLDEDSHLITANEGNAVALAAGHYLGTGKPALVYLQNSGLGNMVNPLVSLASERVYKIPMLLMIGWRGEPGVADEPQHQFQGEITLSLLEKMGIPSFVIDAQTDIEMVLDKAFEIINTESKQVALVVKKESFEKYASSNSFSDSFPREEALKQIVDAIPNEALVLSTTGKLSRELYEHRMRTQDNCDDFLNVGSMGHVSQVALGVSLACSQDVYCFDGDGAALMHLGGMGIIAQRAKGNFKHILFNNGAHESVGGQPTVGKLLNWELLARGFGYKGYFKASNSDELFQILKTFVSLEGPILLELEVGVLSRKDLGRPKSTPLENRNQFMGKVASD